MQCVYAMSASLNPTGLGMDCGRIDVESAMGLKDDLLAWELWVVQRADPILTVSIPFCTATLGILSSTAPPTLTASAHAVISKPYSKRAPRTTQQQGVPRKWSPLPASQRESSPATSLETSNTRSAPRYPDSSESVVPQSTTPSRSHL